MSGDERRESAHLVVHCSPLGVDNHKVASLVASLLSLGNLVFTELLDRPRSVDVGAVGARTKDGTDQSRSVLVRSRQQCSDGLGHG